MYNNRNNNSHGLITVGIIAAIALAIFIFVSIPKGYHNDEKWAGDAHIVKFESVMVRNAPAGEIIGFLETGDKVKATGNRYYFIDSDDSLGSDHWSEIELEDESVVWVIGSAVKLDD